MKKVDVETVLIDSVPVYWFRKKTSIAKNTYNHNDMKFQIH